MLYFISSFFFPPTAGDPCKKFLELILPKSLDLISFVTYKFSLHPLTALLGHPVQKYFPFFLLIKKIFLQILVEVIYNNNPKYF